MALMWKSCPLLTTCIRLQGHPQTRRESVFGPIAKHTCAYALLAHIHRFVFRFTKRCGPYTCIWGNLPKGRSRYCSHEILPVGRLVTKFWRRTLSFSPELTVGLTDTISFLFFRENLKFLSKGQWTYGPTYCLDYFNTTCQTMTFCLTYSDYGSNVIKRSECISKIMF